MIKSAILTLGLCTLLSHIHASEFPMGDASKQWGVRVENLDSQFKLRLGTRIQALAAISETAQDNEKLINTDFHVRRMRLMIEVNYIEGWKFYADIRNDEVNKEDKGEQDFNVGDAFLQKKVSSGKVRLLRAKVDVSRTQTVSSARLLYMNRSSIADHAAHYVSHNRRATNIQYLGEVGERLNYQFVIGDGVYSSKFFDAKRNRASNIIRQNAMIGTRIRYAPLEGYQQQKLTETYYGKDRVFEVGFGAYNTSNIELSNGTQELQTSRTLYNAEVTFVKGPFSIFTELYSFQGEFEDLTTSDRIGSSSGWTVQGEYFFDNFIAPYYRISKWNRFDQEDGFDQDSYVVGLNCYLKGEKFRYGVFYTHDEFGEEVGDKTEDSAQVTLMMNY